MAKKEWHRSRTFKPGRGMFDDETLAELDLTEDDLSLEAVIFRHPIAFTEYFGPKWAYSVISLGYGAVKEGEEEYLEVMARVRPAHKPIHGTETFFEVPLGKAQVWRKNHQLYKFLNKSK